MTTYARLVVFDLFVSLWVFFFSPLVLYLFLGDNFHSVIAYMLRRGTETNQGVVEP